MPSLLCCPSCEGLLPAGRESCPHCDHRPSSLKHLAAGAAVAIGFATFVACNTITPVVEYGPCIGCGPHIDMADGGVTDGGTAGDAGKGDGG